MLTIRNIESLHRRPDSEAGHDRQMYEPLCILNFDLECKSAGVLRDPRSYSERTIGLQNCAINLLGSHFQLKSRYF